MKTLTVPLLGVLLLLGPIAGLRGLAAAQDAPARIVYDQWTPIGWDVLPSIYTWVDGADAFIGLGYGPRWAPDGSRVAFTGNPADAYALHEIVVANLGDGSIANLTNHAAHDTSPAWSPDGGKIAFVTDRDAAVSPGGPFELYVMNVDGSNPTRLTYNVGFRFAFAWSPDGRRIAFGSDRHGTPELYVMGADGSNPMRLTNGVGFRGEFDWARASDTIAFACEIESGNLDVCAIGADGSNFQRLTSEPTDDSGPDFSPVDGRIVFASSGAIAILNDDGTVRRIGATGSQPKWSADATRVAFVGTTVTWMGTCYFEEGAHNADDFCLPIDDVYIVNVDGTGLTRIGSGGAIEWFVPPAGRPIASFTYRCTGSTCEFDASASADSDGIIASYAWQFGDSAAGSGPTIGHAYAGGNSYLVTLTVTDDTGTTGVLSRSVDANAAPTAAFVVTCVEGRCTFDGTSSLDPDGRIVSYVWSFGDGSGGYGAMATHTYAAVGSYTVWLRVGDNAGAVSLNQEATVSIRDVNAAPVASFTSSCLHLTCSFDASGSSDPDGSVTSYVWNLGDGTTGTGRTFSHTYARGGTYPVTLLVADDDGATSVRAASVTAVPPAMHVGDLDAARTTQQNTWTARVTITVHDEAHAPLANATVRGSWNDGTLSSCTTGANGQCAVLKTGLPKKPTSVDFTIGEVTRAPYVFRYAASHDPDGDSTGTSINVYIAR